jgi:hypothetical protein
MGNPKTTGPDYLDQKPKKKKEPTSMQKRLSEESRKPRRGNPDGLFNAQGVRIFEDGTPVTSKNYKDYLKDRSAPPEKKKK